MNIFFDTETTGIPRDYKAPISDAENWPRLVQLGFIVTEGTEVVTEKEYIIKPSGFEIPVQASNLHGITTEKALAEGELISDVLEDFSSWLGLCEKVIGHNVDFDVHVVGAEFYRLQGNSPLEGKQTVCTMQSSIEFVGIPTKWGFKFPKLHELYFSLFQKEMGKAHTALQDISNTVLCYNALVEKGIIK